MAYRYANSALRSRWVSVVLSSSSRTLVATSLPSTWPTSPIKFIVALPFPSRRAITQSQCLPIGGHGVETSLFLTAIVPNDDVLSFYVPAFTKIPSVAVAFEEGSANCTTLVKTSRREPAPDFLWCV